MGITKTLIAFSREKLVRLFKENYMEPRECWFRSLTLTKILVLVKRTFLSLPTEFCQDSGLDNIIAINKIKFWLQIQPFIFLDEFIHEEMWASRKNCRSLPFSKIYQDSGLDKILATNKILALNKSLRED